jgi:hypothetical protein
MITNTVGTHSMPRADDASRLERLLVAVLHLHLTLLTLTQEPKAWSLSNDRFENVGNGFLLILG